MAVAAGVPGTRAASQMTGAGSEGGIRVSAARVAGDDTRTRFIADLSEGVVYSVSGLADPYRIIIDLPEVQFDLERETGATGRGLVSAWRYGLFAPGKSRVVLDMSGPVKIDKSFVLPPVDGQPARLVIDFVKSTRASFEVDFAREERPDPGQADEAHGKGDRMAVAPPQSGRPVIVLDPGHGGIDSGATGHKGTLEKAVVLDFASVLKRKLEQEGLYDVHLTRTSDTFIPLRKRVEMARALDAKLFISIHADSAPQSYVRGATVYTLSERASDRVAAALAERENSSDVLAGVDLTEEPGDVADILIDLTRRETKNFSIFLSRAIVGELRSAIRLIKNPQRSAGFRVLKAHDVPSVLVELGYLSNKHDETLLTSPEWRERTTDAIAAAIGRFFRPQLAKGGE
ncbi:N-acetylmuramoyl-L-alanine amidase [Breoghania sp. L-A4]|nr:N-acetylmuramoyl-L-alanine amidase [Breoghania sp. L-A4]